MRWSSWAACSVIGLNVTYLAGRNNFCFDGMQTEKIFFHSVRSQTESYYLTPLNELRINLLQSLRNKLCQLHFIRVFLWILKFGVYLSQGNVLEYRSEDVQAFIDAQAKLLKKGHIKYLELMNIHRMGICKYLVKMNAISRRPFESLMKGKNSCHETAWNSCKKPWNIIITNLYKERPWV